MARRYSEGWKINSSWRVTFEGWAWVEMWDGTSSLWCRGCNCKWLIMCLSDISTASLPPQLLPLLSRREGEDVLSNVSDGGNNGSRQSWADGALMRASVLAAHFSKSKWNAFHSCIKCLCFAVASATCLLWVPGRAISRKDRRRWLTELNRCTPAVLKGSLLFH